MKFSRFFKCFKRKPKEIKPPDSDSEQDQFNVQVAPETLIDATKTIRRVRRRKPTPYPADFIIIGQ